MGERLQQAAETVAGQRLVSSTDSGERQEEMRKLEERKREEGEREHGYWEIDMAGVLELSRDGADAASQSSVLMRLAWGIAHHGRQMSPSTAAG